MTSPIKKTVVIGDCTLHLGNSLEIMPLLGGFDACVTDPPYKLTYGGQHGSFGGKLSLENYDNKGGIVVCDLDWPDFMPLIFEKLNDNSHAYIMANNRHVQNLLNSASDAGFRFHNLLVWDKGTATANRWYMKNLEFTGFFYKGKAKFINDCGSKQLMRCPNILNSPHPTEKPSSLMSHYIGNSTHHGDSVIDPFMGVGSTGVGCAKLGRKFTGIEIDEKYFSIACDKIRAAYNQSDMFSNSPAALTPVTLSLDLGEDAA